MTLNILTRKPRNAECEYILVSRGPGHDCPFVVGTANAHSLAHGEWFWGHYFPSLELAFEYFNSLPSFPAVP